MLLKDHIELSSFREAGVLSDIIRGYFVHMQMEEYIVYVSAPYVQAGAEHNFTNKQKNLHFKSKQRRENMQCYFVSKTCFYRCVFFYLGGGGFFFSYKRKTNLF